MSSEPIEQTSYTVLPEPPRVMVDFIRRLPQPAESDTAARQRPRRVVATTCSVTPLNENLEPIGRAFRAVTRDISTIGIALLYGHPVDAPVLEISLPRPGGSPILVYARLIRCRKLGPYYDIAARLFDRKDRHRASGEQTREPAAEPSADESSEQPA